MNVINKQHKNDNKVKDTVPNYCQLLRHRISHAKQYNLDSKRFSSFTKKA